MTDFAELSKPFNRVEWRIGSSGVKNGKVWARAFCYLDARDIQSRLDMVCGPSNWKITFQEAKDGFLCGISIWDGDKNEWVTKWDGAEKSDFEAFKGGLSGAMKRAAVQWGIGRYLYNLESEFVETSTERVQGWEYAKTKDNTVFWWKIPGNPNNPGNPSKPVNTPASSNGSASIYDKTKQRLETMDLGDFGFSRWDAAGNYLVDSYSTGKITADQYDNLSRILDSLVPKFCSGLDSVNTVSIIRDVVKAERDKHDPVRLSVWDECLASRRAELESA